MAVAANIPLIKHQGMLAELYLDAVLADEKAADAVWALWDAGVIDDDQAALARFPLSYRENRSYVEAGYPEQFG
jgi:hypothetical protein